MKLRPGHLATALLSLLVVGSARAESAPTFRELRVSMKGTALLFDGQLLDADGRVKNLALEVRAVDSSFRGRPMTIAGNRAMAEVEAADLLRGSDSLRVLYFVIGLDAKGNVVLRHGSAEKPISVYVTRIFEPSQLGAEGTPADAKLAQLPVTDSVPPPPSPTDPPPPPAVAGKPAWLPWVVIGGMVVLGAGIAATLIIID